MDVSSKKSLATTNVMLPAIERNPHSSGLWQQVLKTSTWSRDCLGWLLTVEFG
jgi:hypothetical protein